MDDYCFICGKYGPVEKHHIFGQAYRAKSEKYGYVLRLCPACHTGDKDSVHLNREKRTQLKAQAQLEFELTHTREQFREVFGKSYLTEDA